MLSPLVYTDLQEKKEEGFARLLQPMYAKLREHGAPVQGAMLVRMREICCPTNVTLTLLGFPFPDK
jgi:hypothetical protein